MNIEEKKQILCVASRLLESGRQKQQRRSLGDIRIVACNEKIREIREIRVRLKRIILSVEHESFETKQLIRVIRAIRVPKKIRNSRAEKYLLL